METRPNQYHPTPEEVRRRPDLPRSRRRQRNDRLQRMGRRLQDEHRIADLERQQEEFDEAQETGKKRAAGRPKTAVEKLKSISPADGIPQEVRETMKEVEIWFANGLPEATSENLLSTRIKGSGVEFFE